MCRCPAPGRQRKPETFLPGSKTAMRHRRRITLGWAAALLALLDARGYSR